MIYNLDEQKLEHLLDAYIILNTNTKEVKISKNLKLHFDQANFDSLLHLKSETQYTIGSRSFNLKKVSLSDELDLIQFKDITKELADKKNLETSNHSLERFAYVVSHDLQAPIRRISSLTEVIKDLLEEGDQDSANHYLDKVMTICHESSEMIFALLNLCKINNEDFSKQKIKLDKIISSAISQFSQQCDNGDLIINTNTPKDIELIVNSHYIRDVFVNLISNSYKYKRDIAKIDIEAKLKEHSIIIQLTDNGIGIKNTKDIFTFYKREAHDISGHGIGLSICQTIIQKHQGRIWCESELGVGSCFFIELPIKNKNQF